MLVRCRLPVGATPNPLQSLCTSAFEPCRVRWLGVSQNKLLRTNPWWLRNYFLSLQATKAIVMSKKEKEEKAKEFWEYYEATQGTITITDPIVLD